MLSDREKNILASFLNTKESKIEMFYGKFQDHVNYLKKIFTKDKSLSLKESFVLYVVSQLFGVKNISELGVRYGISTRFWLNTVQGCQLTGYDLKKLYNKRLKPIKSSNFKFIQGDVSRLFDYSQKTDLIFYDVHPYKITYKIAKKSKDQVNIHCFHDVGKDCFKVNSADIAVSKRQSCSEKHGWWERHVMSDVFNKAIAHTDISIGDNWRSLIIDDRYGIGIVLNNSLVEGK